MTTEQAFWDDVHAAAHTNEPRPNVRLVEAVADLPAGEALDLGCGKGGDAIWLARRGWHVTAADISAVAVRKLAATAAAQGLDQRITAQQHDLHHAFPAGSYDLVSAHYLHTPFELDRAALFRNAARALRPGGILLIVDHGSVAPWSWDQDARFPSPRETAEEIGLDPARWATDRADATTRTATGPDGETAEVVDHVLILRRTP